MASSKWARRITVKPHLFQNNGVWYCVSFLGIGAGSSQRVAYRRWLEVRR
jgi:hypothetical protein